MLSLHTPSDCALSSDEESAELIEHSPSRGKNGCVGCFDLLDKLSLDYAPLRINAYAFTLCLTIATRSRITPPHTHVLV